MTTRAPITPLQPALRRVAQHLVEGLTTQEITTRTGLSLDTIRQYVRDIRDCVHCPPRCKPPMVVHLLLVAEQVTPPTTDKPTPLLNPEQQQLLQAVAEHSATGDIALAANIAPADVRATLDELLHTTGAADDTQLVALAHTWGLLGNRAPGTKESGVGQ
ncbi:DNA-binding protein [Streptomyces sp. NPDC059783]|uniref:DNA-binding protein n=1 Tax=Streptomyces sp. NPDC059783 TaxID=3346944 RepID=UPI00365AAE13